MKRVADGLGSVTTLVMEAEEVERATRIALGVIDMQHDYIIKGVAGWLCVLAGQIDKALSYQMSQDHCTYWIGPGTTCFQHSPFIASTQLFICHIFPTSSFGSILRSVSYWATIQGLVSSNVVSLSTLARLRRQTVRHRVCLDRYVLVCARTILESMLRL